MSPVYAGHSAVDVTRLCVDKSLGKQVFVENQARHRVVLGRLDSGLPAFVSRSGPRPPVTGELRGGDGAFERYSTRRRGTRSVDGKRMSLPLAVR